MIKHISLILLSMSSLIIAMNNNDPRPVRFDSMEVLFYRLHNYDQKHKTHYASLGIHRQLGNSIRTREEASTLIKFALKKDNPDMIDPAMLHHKREIMNVLHPELAEKQPKL